MRKSPILTALFPMTRRQILAAMFLQPDRWWYLTELASCLGTSPSSLQRELDSLARNGIIERKREGHRSFFRAQSASPAFEPLGLLFAKTAGVVPSLQAEIDRVGSKVSWAFIYGSVARGQEHALSDIDLMVIGDIKTAELLPALRRLERRFSREVNVTRYSTKEFLEKAHRSDHFLGSVLKEETIFLKGSKDELAAAAR
jgi:predicted nucleotidyltransferase